MKKETLRTVGVLTVTGAGALLIGFCAGRLQDAIHVGLFVLGIVLVSMSTTLLGLFETLWKKNAQKHTVKNETKSENR